MIVVEDMILAYALIDVPGLSEDVNRSLEKDAACASPPLWRSELRNVLLKYVRTDHPDVPGSELGLNDALRKMQTAEQFMNGHTMEVSTDDVLRLADRSGLTAYDCEYVALAKETGCELLTPDRAVLNAFPDTAVHPRDFATP